ncbi:MAG: ABC transporter substrate-binding protein [Gorillibacterium sp.]|nr:ABC transporter substrate-binding protein [Gorillibacterium sp.]
MKGSRKRFTILTSLVVSTSLLLSACGSSKEAASPSVPAESNSSAAVSPAANEKPVNLIWYTIGTPQKDVSRVMTEVNKYTLEKINTTVEMKMLDWGDYTQKMQVMVASGEPMDILFTCSWAFDYVQNARKGAFYELDGLLDKYGKEAKAAIDPAFFEGSKVDGHNYAIPANKELPAQEVWRFNKNLLDKYKIDIAGVKTLESLEPLLKKIKEADPGVVAFSTDKNYNPVLPYDYVITNSPMAVKLDTKDYKVVNILETPEMLASIKTMRKYYQAGYLPAEVANTTSVEDLNKSGNWFLDRATTQPLADNLWSASLGYPIVSTPASDAVIYNWSVMGSMQAISANSEHPEAAMKFLNLLNSDPKLRNMIDFGIEDVHYKKISDNMVKNLDEAKNYDMPTFTLGNILITHLLEGDPENKWEEFKKYNEAGVPAPLLGFNFNGSSVLNELAAVQNVREEVWSSLMTGTVDPEVYLPKAIERFKEAGLDKVIAEVQTQLDAWRAENNK